jgi:hypothetical protein
MKLTKSIIEKIEKSDWDVWIKEHDKELTAGVLTFLVIAFFVLGWMVNR